MHTTSRLGLDVPDSSDNESAYPADAAQSLGILDNAVTYAEGTLVSRGTPSYHGQLYKTTDSGAETLSWFDGAMWLPLGLIPAIVTASGSVVSGQALIVTGSSAVTITLPSHAVGQIVAVLNYSTGGTTVSGTSIQGLGLSAASSFALGASGAGAVLIDDGTSWRFLAGQQDTGWVSLSLHAGTATAPGTSGYAPAARIQGDRVRLRGGIENTSGSSWTANTVFTTLPSSAFVPAAEIETVGTDGLGTVVLYTLNPPTTALYVQSAISNTDVLHLDNASYPLN